MTFGDATSFGDSNKDSKQTTRDQRQRGFGDAAGFGDAGGFDPDARQRRRSDTQR